MSGSGLLLDERMVSAQPSLVRALGLTRAVVLQQINWHLRAADHGIEHQGHEWFPITLADLAAEIGLTADVVRRAVEALERDEIVLSCQPEGHQSRRKWYRIDYDHTVLSVPSVQVAKLPLQKRRNSHFPSGETATSSSIAEEALEPARAEARESGDDLSKRRAQRPRTQSDGVDPRAKTLTDAWWELFDPRPARHSWISTAKIVTELVRTPASVPWTDDEFAEALQACGRSPSTAFLERHLERIRGLARTAEARRRLDPGQAG